MVSAGDNGAAILFRYGVTVLFGLTAVEEVAFLRNLDPFVIEPFERCELEETQLGLPDKRTDDNDRECITLDAFNLPRLQLVADVLVKSIVLAHYENALAATFDRIEPLAHAFSMAGVSGTGGVSCWPISAMS